MSTSGSDLSQYCLEEFGEIGAVRSVEIPEEVAKLTPDERVVLYYLYRAGLPMNRVFQDQMHPKANEILRVVEHLINEVESRKLVEEGVVSGEVLSDLRTYFVYIATNHSQYYLREHANNKRTPSRIGLSALTQDLYQNLVMNICGVPESVSGDPLASVPYIFDASFEPELCVTGNIAESSSGLYGPGFTNESYSALDAGSRGGINSYYYLDSSGSPAVRRYGAADGLQNSEELSVALVWLQRALDHCRGCVDREVKNENGELVFDSVFVESLDLLVRFIETGDEEYFKEHCKKWVLTKCRLDYLFGFIECYEDPLDVISMATSEVTVKNPKISGLDGLLLGLEKLLPYPDSFKRTVVTAGNNCSSNIKLCTSGANGPLSILAAYCLPNYDEIRTNFGSKQICYKMGKRISELMNPELSARLAFPAVFYRSVVDKRGVRLSQEDVRRMYDDIWDIQVVLHETTGHGSGRFGVHTFKENARICDVDYQAGDTLAVDDKNIKEFIHDYGSMEEMRAEINALYLCLAGYSQLRDTPLYQEWDLRLGEQEFKRHLVNGMTRVFLRRYFTQREGFENVSGAHAIADVVISNWVLSRGGIQVIEETQVIDGQTYNVLGVDVVDLDVVFSAVRDLCEMVQTIKSQGLGLEYQELVAQYTTGPISISQGNRYREIAHANMKAVAGRLNISAEVVPNFVPVVDSVSGQVIDMKCEWGSGGLVGQIRHQRSLEMSTE